MTWKLDENIRSWGENFRHSEKKKKLLAVY